MHLHKNEADRKFKEEKYSHYIKKRIMNCNAAIEQRNRLCNRAETARPLVGVSERMSSR